MPRLIPALILVFASGVADAAPDGKALYQRFCLACHGAAGDGGGPAARWLWPRPRDFTRGEYKWRSTPIADGATLRDLEDSIRFGAPGTSMPGYAGILSDAQITALAQVVRAFAPDTRFARAGTAPPAPPAASRADRGAALWTQLGCVSCHGANGKGDGTAAATLRDPRGRRAPPYDLTAAPLRRPRASDDARDVKSALWASIAWGLAGTSMPGYRGQVKPDDLWAIVDHVEALRWRGAEAAGIAKLSPGAIDADRDEPVGAGVWPGSGAPAEAALFGGTIALQGEPPAALTPAQASLSSQQCARCHNKQAREWRGSLHGHAASPGLVAQLLHPGAHGEVGSWAEVESCQRCHAPLAEQLPQIRAGHRGGDDKATTYSANAAYDAGLRDEGITCAGCHVRAWQRHGPPRVAPSLIPMESYPLATLDVYERSDFCLPCHQLPARLAVAGKPLLDTYREWALGPYMRRGVQCQHCHMPNREHTWKGVHDPDTFRQGIAVAGRATRGAGGAIAVRATLTNVGAGHYLPTTPTPAAWLRVELLDDAGRAIDGTRKARRIGRKISYAGGWREHEDTRVPPGAAIELAATFAGDAAGRARWLEVTVAVHPDDFYEGFYAAQLRKPKLPAGARALYEIAARRARASHYEAHRARYPVTK